MPAGRPSDYTPEIVDRICQRISDGVGLREICRDPEFPGHSTVHRWLLQHQEFRDQYALAREAQAEHWADEILEIADDASNDYLQRQLDNGAVAEVPDKEHINRSRLRVDSRKWLMSKLAPKKWGDRQAVDLTVTNDLASVIEAARRRVGD